MKTNNVAPTQRVPVHAALRALASTLLATPGLDCGQCQQVLPEYIEIQQPGTCAELLPAHLHLASCPPCAQAYADLVEITLVEEAGTLPELAAPIQFDLSWLKLGDEASDES